MRSCSLLQPACQPAHRDSLMSRRAGWQSGARFSGLHLHAKPKNSTPVHSRPHRHSLTPTLAPHHAAACRRAPLAIYKPPHTRSHPFSPSALPDDDPVKVLIRHQGDGGLRRRAEDVRHDAPVEPAEPLGAPQVPDGARDGGAVKGIVSNHCALLQDGADHLVRSGKGKEE
eukprot:scaffold12101_cov110-Isochrysis_galbana.AAC.3